MTKNEIIEQWFRENVVQDIVRKVTNGKQDAKYDDLIQIVYVYLLEKPDDFIESLYNSGEYKYFIARMVMLQLTSPRSKHYYHLRRFSAKSSKYDYNKPDDTEEGNEDREQLYQLMDLLPEEDREILQLYDYYGSKKEIMARSGMSFYMVKKKLNNAIAKLKDACLLENNRVKK